MARRAGWIVWLPLGALALGGAQHCQWKRKHHSCAFWATPISWYIHRGRKFTPNSHRIHPRFPTPNSPRIHPRGDEIHPVFLPRHPKFTHLPDIFVFSTTCTISTCLPLRMYFPSYLFVSCPHLFSASRRLIQLHVVTIPAFLLHVLPSHDHAPSPPQPRRCPMQDVHVF